MHKKLSLLMLAGVVSLPLVAQNQTPAAPAGPQESASQGTVVASPAGRRENRDPLLDLPELPNNKVTLVGGRVKSLDEVMNKMVVVPFGSKQNVPVSFDTRTDFFQDGKPISYRAIREGQRVYVDTMLNGTTVFAKKIWIQSAADSGIGRNTRLSLSVTSFPTSPSKCSFPHPRFLRRGKNPRALAISSPARWFRSVSARKGSCAR